MDGEYKRPVTWCTMRIITMTNCVEQRVLEECQGQQLHLTCAQGTVIQLLSIGLVDSRCRGSGNCCPRPDDCSAAPSAEHQRTVQQICDGQNSCSVTTEKRKIRCGHLTWPVYNDYERIIYRCIGLSPTLLSLMHLYALHKRML